MCQEGSQLEAKELAKTCWALAKLSMNSAPVMDQLWGVRAEWIDVLPSG